MSSGPRLSGRWLGEELHQWPSIDLADVPAFLPTFTRTPIMPVIPNWVNHRSHQPELTGEAVQHRYLDIVLRDEWREFPAVPIAMVSKAYGLVGHSQLAGTLMAALEDAEIPSPATCQTTVSLSEYGTRMHLLIALPEQFSPPDDHALVPTLHCWNSVDGQRRLEVQIGWFRFVCSNGLLIGDAVGRVARRHVGSLELSDLIPEVVRQLRQVPEQAETMRRWAGQQVDAEQVTAWADSALAAAWGPLNAARVLHLVRSGVVVRFPGAHSRDEAKLAPSRRTVVHETHVPGSEPPNDNLYRVSQALSWVAGSRTELEGRQERLRQIPALLKALRKA